MSADPSRDDELWLRRHGRPAPALRLVCFPHAGGTAGMFRPWPEVLPQSIEVVAAKLPGREARFAEPALTTAAAIAAAVAPVVIPLLDRPYALFGHSVGAVAAYELALELIAAGQRPPAKLLLSAHRAPHRSSGEALHELSDEALVAEIRRRYGDQAGALDHPELVELMLPTLRADCGVGECYARDPATAAIDAPITVLGGRDDDALPQEDLEAWRDFTRAAFRCRWFAGDHFYLESARAEVLAAIAEELAAGSGC